MKLRYTSIRGVKTNSDLISTVQELLNYIQDIEKSWSMTNLLWYRGLSHSNYPLLPSIYRKEIWEYDAEEAKEICTEFIRRAKTFKQNQGEYSKWEWYYLMQHYGVPTRLLDWTEGALIALFFAVRKVDRVDIPCVWVLDPKRLNRLSSGEEMIYYSDPTYREEIDKPVLRYLEDEKKFPFIR
jgi:hypothetical protein